MFLICSFFQIFEHQRSYKQGSYSTNSVYYFPFYKLIRKIKKSLPSIFENRNSPSRVVYYADFKNISTYKFFSVSHSFGSYSP